MQLTTAVAGRWTLALATSLGLATVANYANHKGYWEGTIHRVQTVDFNILAHMLPTKLSYALIEGDSEELQRTINSNYGLFGLVVTDCQADTAACSEQNILYASESYLDWRTELDNRGIDFLTDTEAPYSILYDPPPLLTTDGYEDSRDETWNPTGLENEGEIIGRVYYVRGIPPSFWNYYGRWITGIPSGSLLSDSGAYKYFSLTIALFLLGGVAGVGVLEAVMAQKRLKEEKLNQTAEELQVIRHERNGLLGEKNKLLAESNTVKLEKEKLNQQLQNQKHSYEEKLRERLKFGQQTRQEIESLEKEINLISTQQWESQTQLEERDQTIGNLLSQLDSLKKSEQDNEKSIIEYTRKVDALQESLEKSNQEIKHLNERIAHIEKTKEDLINNSRLLEESLEDARQEEINLRKEHEEELDLYIQENKILQDRINQYVDIASEFENENKRLKTNLENRIAQQEYEEKQESSTLSEIHEDRNHDIISKSDIDFSAIRIGLVGGNADLQNKIIEALYTLGIQKEPKQIFDDKRIATKEIKSKLKHCNFIAMFRHGNGHSIVYQAESAIKGKAFRNTFKHYFNSKRPNSSDIISEIILTIRNDFGDHPNVAA
jgi:hypothetical protein